MRSHEKVGMRISVMSALIPGAQLQAVLFDGESLEDVDKFKYLGSMFIENGLGTEEIKSRINLALFAYSRLQFCLWSRREISLRPKGRVNQAVVRPILLCGCEMWPVRVTDKRMLTVFENDSVHHILHMSRRDAYQQQNCLLVLASAFTRGGLSRHHQGRNMVWFRG